MIRIYLTVDPQTRRALYDDESKLLGTFNSIQHALAELGADILAFCNIKSI